MTEQLYKCTKRGNLFVQSEIVEQEGEEYLEFLSPCCLAEYDDVQS